MADSGVSSDRFRHTLPQTLPPPAPRGRSAVTLEIRVCYSAVEFVLWLVGGGGLVDSVGFGFGRLFRLLFLPLVALELATVLVGHAKHPGRHGGEGQRDCDRLAQPEHAHGGVCFWRNGVANRD